MDENQQLWIQFGVKNALHREIIPYFSISVDYHGF